nr:immunoglobulin heavy chain junction region [Homo sapiens]MBN4430388.1 immunoglobulin heavy chain junction region [Homo sapiens]
AGSPSPETIPRTRCIC